MTASREARLWQVPQGIFRQDPLEVGNGIGGEIADGERTPGCLPGVQVIDFRLTSIKPGGAARHASGAALASMPAFPLELLARAAPRVTAR
jgi:hypothetical protein